MKQVEMLKYGDIVIIYRTAENGKSAEYSAVATSVCVIEEVKIRMNLIRLKNFTDI